MRVRIRLVSRVAMVIAGAAVLAGCSPSGLANSFDAPIQALKASDTAVETTVELVDTAADTTYAPLHSYATFAASAGSSGVSVTTGASPGPAQTSYAILPGDQAIVLAAWNHADFHCIGLVDAKQALSTPVFGQSAPGTYYFVAPANASSDCNASTFAAMGSAPSGWPYDPSSSRYPLP